MISLICGIYRKKETKKQNTKRLINTENKLEVAIGEEDSILTEIGERYKEVQTSNYKINKSLG